MPRYVQGTRKYTVDQRRKQADTFRFFGYTDWIDPFLAVLGTGPEKIVYAALSYRGIPFWFQDEVRFTIKELGFNKDYRPDFVLPTLRIIIEVQGAYWHSKPKTIESDAFKFAVYEQTGWRVVAWWDYEIEANVNKLFAADPQLSRYGVKQDFSSEVNNGRKVVRDDSKGIVTLNKKRAARLSYRKKPAKIKDKRKQRSYGSYSIYGK